MVAAYGFAYAMERTCMPFKLVLRMIALIPIFSPSLVQALGLQFLLGRNGLINRTFGTEIDIYGCVSSEGWRVQQEVDLPGQQSGAP